MNPEQKTGPEGLWAACEQMEVAATIALASQLASFESPLRNCYEAGVQAPTLPGTRHKEPDTLVAALFLKKTLNDLRSTWVLLRIGYTSQAAAVAASLYENALATSCLAGDLGHAQQFHNNKSGDLPWSPQQLAKKLAQRWRAEALNAGKQFEQEEYEQAWREVYSAYKWLCKIKHPTHRSAMHDSFAASARADEYVVMAAPDIRPENLPVKATILAIAINRTREAIRYFVLALDCDEKASEYDSFKTRMEKALSESKSAYEAAMIQPHFHQKVHA